MSTAYGACSDSNAKYPGRITYIIDASGNIEYGETVSDIEAHIHTAIARLNDG